MYKLIAYLYLFDLNVILVTLSINRYQTMVKHRFLSLVLH